MPIDIDLPRVGGEVKVEVIVGHQVDGAEIMVRVQVAKEDCSNRFRWNPKLDPGAGCPMPQPIKGVAWGMWTIHRFRTSAVIIIGSNVLLYLKTWKPSPL